MLDHPAITELHARYTAMEEPGRARDAAEALGVSEAELVEAKGLDEISRPLRRDPDLGFTPIIEGLEGLGEFMVLTRNDHAVHERHGAFANINIGPVMGLVLNRSVDLRIFMNRWAFGFAVEEEVRSGKRLSLQFFDMAGTAVHKVYAVEGTDRAGLEQLIEASLDPAPAKIAPTPVAAEPPDRPDSEIDVAALRKDWQAMTDTHQFFGLLKEHGVGRLQSFRLVGDDLAKRIDNGAVTRMLELAAAREVPIMCFVGNRGCIQIHSGPVKKIKPMGPWINVLDPEFNLHLRTDRVASAWIVRKPTEDGIVTALELFDDTGFAFAIFFGVRERGEKEREDWRAVLADLEPEVVA